MTGWQLKVATGHHPLSILPTGRIEVAPDERFLVLAFVCFLVVVVSLAWGRKGS